MFIFFLNIKFKKKNYVVLSLNAPIKKQAQSRVKQTRAKPEEDATPSTACCRLLMSTVDVDF